MQLAFKQPVIVARRGNTVILIEATTVGQVNPPAQFYSETRGYSALWLLDEICNLMTIDSIDPPQLWQEPGTRRPQLLPIAVG